MALELVTGKDNGKSYLAFLYGFQESLAMATALHPKGCNLAIDQEL
jgi:hypothetical protein